MYKFGLLAVLGLLVWGTAHAADERYAVEVSVDVTDSSASAAQERAAPYIFALCRRNQYALYH